MEIQIINCFCTDEPNSGNPAAIAINFIGDKASKQKLAKELGLPVTVFVSKISKKQCNLEFFYPDTEMPLCLHGTLGASYILFRDKSWKNLTCITKNGIKLSVRNQGNNIAQVLVSKNQVPDIILDKNEICKMLNLSNVDEIDNKFPLEISSVGSPKLLVPLRSFALLAALKPDFSSISKWSRENKINGLYVYTNDVQNNALDFYARGFNPKTGHNEDAATGVAAAALALSLRKSIGVGQGIFIQRSSRISISYNDPENIWVGGKIVFVSTL